MSKDQIRQKIDRLFRLSGIYISLEDHMSAIKMILMARYNTTTNMDYIESTIDLDRQDLIENMIDLYEENFDSSEIDNMITFWTTEEGRKLTNNSFVEKLRIVGARWAAQLDTKIFQEINK